MHSSEIILIFSFYVVLLPLSPLHRVAHFCRLSGECDVLLPSTWHLKLRFIAIFIARFLNWQICLESFINSLLVKSLSSVLASLHCYRCYRGTSIFKILMSSTDNSYFLFPSPFFAAFFVLLTPSHINFGLRLSMDVRLFFPIHIITLLFLMVSWFSST